jgi:hypothetical protein
VGVSRASWSVLAEAAQGATRSAGPAPALESSVPAPAGLAVRLVPAPKAEEGSQAAEAQAQSERQFDPAHIDTAEFIGVLLLARYRGNLYDAAF